jgi:hypothetical protein
MRVDRGKPKGYITKVPPTVARDSVASLYQYAVTKAKAVNDPRLAILQAAQFGPEGTLSRLNIISRVDVDREFDGTFVARRRPFDSVSHRH